MPIAVSSPEGQKIVEDFLFQKTGKKWRWVANRYSDIIVNEPTRIEAWWCHVPVDLIIKENPATVHCISKTITLGTILRLPAASCFAEEDSELVQRMFHLKEVKRKVCL